MWDALFGFMGVAPSAGGIRFNFLRSPGVCRESLLAISWFRPPICRLRSIGYRHLPGTC